LRFNSLGLVIFWFKIGNTEEGGMSPITATAKYPELLAQKQITTPDITDIND